MSDYVDARLDDNDPVRESDGYDISLEDQHYTFDRNFLEAFSTGWHSQAEVESMQPTPPEEKSWSKWSIMALWMGMVINIPSYMIGSAMVTGGLTWWEALLSVFIGNLVLLAPMILNGFPGVKYGIPFPVLLRSMFGFNGAKIAAIVRGLVGCGWFGIQTWIGGAAIYNFIAIFLPVIKSAPSMGEFQGINVAEFFCFWIFWIANMAIVFFGPEKIKILELVSVPFLVLVPIGAFVWAWVSVGDFNQVLDASKQLGIEIETPQRVRLFFTSVTGVISGWVTMSLNIMDYTRYVKHQKDQIVGQVLGLPTTSLFLAALGIFITSATIVLYGKPLWNPVDIISEIDNGWLTAFGSVFIILATLSTNVAANLVSAANDVSNIWPRRITFRIGGVISGLISVLFLPWRLLASPNSFIFQWLIASASLMGGIGAVMIADYFVLRKGHLQIDDLYDSHGLYRFARGWNWRSLVAVVVSVLPTVPGFLVVTGVLSEDSMPFWLAKLYDYTWFISFAIAFGLYLALSKAWKDVSYYEPEQRLNVDGIFDDMNTQGQSMQLEDVY